MPFAEGENVGPYRIMNKLGQGGMATVYKAYHARLDRYVALKVLHPAFHEDETFTGRFQREARVVAKLEHPNIVPVYDFAEHENRPYLVMKYIEGETLKASLSRGSLNTAEIIRIVESVGLALTYAHKQGILHRDVKPSNVLISPDGKIYLADFGLARIAQAGESTLSSDAIMGTPQYISPEQARGDKDLDEGTDIYSFGVMLYEMVVGEVPFNADTPFSIIHDHIYTPLPMPRSINKNVPEGMERVLLKALSKERADRYENVPSMVQAFKTSWDEAVIPIQSTVLTSPTVIAKQGNFAGTVQTPADFGKTTIKQEPEKKPKKKHSPWPYFAVGALLMLCGIFAFVATRKDLQKMFSGLEPTPTPTESVGKIPSEEEPKPPQPEHQPPEPVELPPEVQELKRLADENPEDPFLKLELSLAFWDIGMQRPAYETLNLAAELAKDDPDFLLSAGEQYHVRQAWIASAAMYLRFIKRFGSDRGIPEEVLNNFHEAVYMAAPLPELEVTYPLLDEILRIDQPIGLVAQARHAYYNGRLDDGRVFLTQAKRLKPNFAETALLEAEFAVIENRHVEAKLILQPLIANLEIPAWIRLMAEDLLKKIPS